MCSVYISLSEGSGFRDVQSRPCCTGCARQCYPTLRLSEAQGSAGAQSSVWGCLFAFRAPATSLARLLSAYMTTEGMTTCELVNLIRRVVGLQIRETMASSQLL